MNTRLVRVTGSVRKRSHPFVAGFETNGHVIRAAPILSFLMGKSDAEVRQIIKKNKWKASVVTGQIGIDKISAELEGRPQIIPIAGERTEVFINHNCAVCGKFGPFGIDVCVRMGIPGTWYCYRHWPDRGKKHESERRIQAA